MKSPITMIASLAALSLASVPAAARPQPLPAGYHWGRCLLQVDGKDYISGRCSYNVQAGGSFMIEGPKQDFAALNSGKPFAEMVGKDYFAQLDVRGAEADGYWNEDIRSLHAQTPLGVLKRKGACWLNAKARICLWKR